MEEKNSLVDVVKAAKEKDQIKRRRRKQREWTKFIRPIYFGYLLAIISIVVVISAILAVNAISQANQDQNNLDTLLDTLEKKSATELTIQDYDQLDAALAKFNNSLLSVDRYTLPIQLVSFIDSDLKARFDLLESASSITQGTRFFLAGLKPTITYLERGGILGQGTATPIGTNTSGERVIDLVTIGQSQFLKADQELQNAEITLDQISLDGVSSNTLLQMRILRDYIDQIKSYNNLAQQAPNFLTNALGIEEAQNYLVLSQNNDELRPSGGYISTWGWMEIRSGVIQNYAYYPTVKDSPAPPPNATGTIEIPEWWLQYREPIYAAWDGSWYADFRNTAENAAWFYNNGNNIKSPVDGVIGIDITALRFLIEPLGSVEVPSYGVTVNADNFREMIYAIRGDSDADTNHKEFLQALYTVLIDEWREASPQVQGKINRGLLQAFREKHLMFYIEDDSIQEALEELGWTGSQSVATDIDYIMVNDANLGNKSSSSVRRQITYDIVLSDEAFLSSRLALNYDFSSVIADRDPAVRPEHYGVQKNYSTILQLFTPQNSELVSSEISNGATIINSDTHTIFIGRVLILYDSSARLDFEYQVPNHIEAIGDYQRYRLKLEKQPGSQGDSVTVTISLPPGASPVFTSPTPTATYDLEQTVLEFNITLIEDEWIEVIYQ